MKSKKFRANLITYAIVIAAFIACQVLISTGVMTRSLKGQLVPICAYIVMAISLNLTVGISGELSLDTRGLHERRRVFRNRHVHVAEQGHGAG